MEERFFIEKRVNVGIEFPVAAVDYYDGSTIGEAKQHRVQSVGND